MFYEMTETFDYVAAALRQQVAEQEIDRLNNTITEQAAEIRGLQEEASDYRNEINTLQAELKYMKAFMCIGEGI